MIAITTSSSISVKPRKRRVFTSNLAFGKNGEIAQPARPLDRQRSGPRHAAKGAPRPAPTARGPSGDEVSLVERPGRACRIDPDLREEKSRKDSGRSGH